ncbi:MAG: DUF2188 domain-containing protein [Candidatus Hodarchaeota archaeon]
MHSCYDAVDYGRNKAKGAPLGQLVIHKKDGEIQTENTYKADAGKPAARITTVEVALNHLLDDRPEKAVLLLEATLVLGQDPVKMMEQLPVEHSSLWMTLTLVLLRLRMRRRGWLS